MVGRLLCAIHHSICCPDPCYEPCYIPAANAGFFLDSAKPVTMMRFTISHPALSTTIVGTVNPEHLARNVATATEGPLPASVYEEAKRRLAAAGSVPA